MCGISGVISFGSEPSADLADLRTMHQLLRHRGPDGEGALLVDSSGEATSLGEVPSSLERPFAAAFAFRRLRILDLSLRADQPFARRDRRQWMLFNGEIYNHRELARELDVEWETHSDTEVALAAYQRWGTGCFERFAGMWAMVIVDSARQRIVLSRDRLGIKPLSFAFDEGRLLIASEPMAIAAVLKNGARIDRARMQRFLAGYPQREAERTFFEGVSDFPAASFAELEVGAARPFVDPKRFWIAPSSGGVVRDDRVVDRFRDLLRDAVSSHLVADVPVGALLSGGLDSSTIARLMVQQRERASNLPRTFSLTYDDPAMDESRWINAVIAQGELDATQERFDARRALELTPSVVAAQGEPILGHELVAQHRAFQLARANGVIVVLDGQGADELLGGYPFYEGVMVRDRLRKLRWIDATREIAALARKYERPMSRLTWNYLSAPWYARRKARNGAHYSWMRGDADRELPFDAKEASGSALNRLLYAQTFVTNIPAVLQYQDRNSMASSVEARVPFLDHRVVEMAFALPDAWKIHRGERKRILREAARDWLPADVVARTDKRAFVSTSQWFDLRDFPQAVKMLRDSVDELRVAEIEPDAARTFIDAYVERQHDDRLAVWRLYTTMHWLRRFSPRSSAA